MKIRLLPDEVINKIAAGEVVERPASVVRELMDNSLDAGATDLLIEIEQGGQQLVRVVDNGQGIAIDDAKLAFKRHATSKVSSAEDLLNIATYGFRGEALSSISSVSRVILKTRTEDSKVAYELDLVGGEVKREVNVSGNVGTTIEVRDLFFNTPARKKFLKTPRGETARIKQLIIQSAIARPEVRYRLVVDGEESLVIPRAKSPVERGLRQMSGAPIRVEFEDGEYAVHGAVAHPAMAASDANSFVVLVNKRLVTDKVILKAVREGFQSTLKEREYPVGFILLELPADQVDINVHPQKSEVRFRDSQSIFRIVRRAVAESVAQISAPISASVSAPLAVGDAPFSSSTSSYESSERRGFNQFNSAFTSANLAQEYSKFNTPRVESSLAFDWRRVAEEEQVLNERAESSTSNGFKYSQIKVIGQVLDCYILGQLNDQLIVIDMHAAHERYNYNLIRNSIRSKMVAAQELLVSEVVKLGAEGVERCIEEGEVLLRAGFKFSPYGEDGVLVSAIPSNLQFKGAVQVLREIANAEHPDKGFTAIEQRYDSIAARMACHASVRSGDALSIREIYALLESLDQTEFSAACPHGRPVIVAFSRDQVERWFGRDR